MQNSIDKKQVVKESIFLLESGSNDVFNYFNPLTSSTLSPEDYVQAMLQRVRSFVKQIYTLGARRIAIFSLGPVGCVPARANLPGAPTDQCFLKMNVMVRNFNLGLENIVKDIPGNYSGAVAVYAAVDALFKYFKAHPSQHGNILPLTLSVFFFYILNFLFLVIFVLSVFFVFTRFSIFSYLRGYIIFALLIVMIIM